MSYRAIASLLALLLGADRIMDSMRVSVNLLGNCVATFIVSKWEGQLDYDQMRATFAAAASADEEESASVLQPA